MEQIVVELTEEILDRLPGDWDIEEPPEQEARNVDELKRRSIEDGGQRLMYSSEPLVVIRDDTAFVQPFSGNLHSSSPGDHSRRTDFLAEPFESRGGVSTPFANIVHSKADQDALENMKDELGTPISVFPDPELRLSASYNEQEGRFEVDSPEVPALNMMEEDPDFNVFLDSYAENLLEDKHTVSDLPTELNPVPVMRGDEFLDSERSEIVDHLGESDSWVIQYRAGGGGLGTIKANSVEDVKSTLGRPVAGNLEGNTFGEAADEGLPRPQRFFGNIFLPNPGHGAGLNYVSLIDCVATLEDEIDPESYVVKPFLEHDRDLRAVYVDGEVVNAEYRHAPEDDFKTNLSDPLPEFSVTGKLYEYIRRNKASKAEELFQEDRVEPVNLETGTDDFAELGDPEEQALERIGNYLDDRDIRFASVDLIETEDGYLLGELNAGAGPKVDIYAAAGGFYDQVSSVRLLDAMLNASGSDTSIDDIDSEIDTRVERFYDPDGFYLE